MIELGHYHLAGVAGVGMSGVAQALQAQGCDVSGSDRYCDQGEELEVVGKLRNAGIRFFPQDGSGLTRQTRGLVVSTAIEKDNAEILAAQRLGVPVIHRAEMLGKLVADKSCVAVTGTSGKSTVTGMVGWILDQLGADPTVVNGAVVLNWRSDKTVGNVRFGRSDVWVIEADESDRSLMQYHPDWAVITNASIDHFGYEETVELFRSFTRQVKKGMVSAFDNPGFFEGFAPTLSASGSVFVEQGIEFSVPLPGRHNAENALHAVRLCEKLGFDLRKIAEALATFHGIHRRLEKVGTARGVTVIDDYGHNPAKIRAAWQAVAPYSRRVLAVWRPHGFKPLAVMMDELVQVISGFCRPDDRFYVLPVYDAGGTADRSIRSEMLVEKLKTLKIPADYAADPEAMVATLAAAARSGDVILTMGARDPALPALARKMLARIRAG
jgi:UDP-N-acetylmuramate--alanine ligase